MAAREAAWAPDRDIRFIVEKAVGLRALPAGAICEVGLGASDVMTMPQGQCHQLALALQDRLGGTLVMLWDKTGLPVDGSVNPDPVGEGRVVHVAVRVREGFIVDALGMYKEKDLPTIKTWPRAQGHGVVDIIPDDVRAMIAAGHLDVRRHPDTDAIADHLADKARKHAGDLDTALRRAGVVGTPADIENCLDVLAAQAAAPRRHEAASAWSRRRTLRNGLTVCDCRHSSAFSDLNRIVMSTDIESGQVLATSGDGGAYFVGRARVADRLEKTFGGYVEKLGYEPEHPVLWAASRTSPQVVRRTTAMMVSAEMTAKSAAKASRKAAATEKER